MLKLVNLEQKYKKIKDGKTTIYRNKELNNILVVCLCDKGMTEDDVFNQISGIEYDYIINVLNTQKNVIAMWSAVEGTTSDYSIYLNHNYNEKVTKKKMFEYIHKFSITIGYKYTQTDCSTNVCEKLFTVK